MITLWLLTAVIFSLNGFHLFQGKTLVNGQGNLDLKNGKPNLISFEGLGNSLVFTFFSFYNIDWDVFMYEQYLGCGFVLVVWQFFSLFVGLQLCTKFFMSILMNELGVQLDEYHAKQNKNKLTSTVIKQINMQSQSYPGYAAANTQNILNSKNSLLGNIDGITIKGSKNQLLGSLKRT